MPAPSWIPLSDCEDRRLYRIRSRNLKIGVFSKATRGFIGIRQKFDDRYLFQEYHHDAGAPFGTVRPQEAVPELLPPEMELRVSLDTICKTCGGRVEWRQGDRKWIHLGATACESATPLSQSNRALFDWLVEREKIYGSDER